MHSANAGPRRTTQKKDMPNSSYSPHQKMTTVKKSTHHYVDQNKPTPVNPQRVIRDKSPSNATTEKKDACRKEVKSSDKTKENKKVQYPLIVDLTYQSCKYILIEQEQFHYNTHQKKTNLPHKTTRSYTNAPLFAQGQIVQESRVPLIDVDIFNKLQSDYLQLSALPLNDLPENTRYNFREDAKTVKKTEVQPSNDNYLLQGALENTQLAQRIEEKVKPSPIRKFYEANQLEVLERRNLYGAEESKVHSKKAALHNKAEWDVNPYNSTLRQSINKDSQLIKCREHDDKLMEASPYKSPISRNGQSQKGIVESYQHYSGEENVYSSVNHVKCGSRLEESVPLDRRFIIPNTRITLISSLINQYGDKEECGSSAGTNKQRFSPQRIRILIANQSNNSTPSKFQNFSPIQRPFYCCDTINHFSTRPIAKIADTQDLPKTPTTSSRNFTKGILNNPYHSVRTDDCCTIEDVDEYLTDQIHQRSIVKRSTALNTGSIASPGGRVEETNWLQQMTKSPGMLLKGGSSQLEEGQEPYIEEQPEHAEIQYQEKNTNLTHYNQVVSTLKIIKERLNAPSEDELRHLFVELPPFDAPHKKRTILFDMDETLIHCVDDFETDDPDAIVEILFPDEEEPVCAGFNIRPFLIQTLEEVNKYFQVGVFTASHKAYADAILDFIDPDGTLFQFRLYREHCFQTTPDNYFVKDLSIIRNRPLSDMILIDNSVFSFAFQLANGVPIRPFYDDPADDELYHLATYLRDVSNQENDTDVRVLNKRAFRLEELQSQEGDSDELESDEDIGGGEEVEEAGQSDDLTIAEEGEKSLRGMLKMQGAMDRRSRCPSYKL